MWTFEVPKLTNLRFREKRSFEAIVICNITNGSWKGTMADIKARNDNVWRHRMYVVYHILPIKHPIYFYEYFGGLG